MKINKIGFFILIALSLNSCFDSCDEYGKTFSDVKINSWLVNTNNLEVYFDFNAINQLKSEYFKATQVKSSREVDSAYFVSDKRFIAKIPLDNISFSENNNVEILFLLPDRQGFTKCFHFGADDVYYLDIKVKISKITGNVFEVTDLDWKESTVKKETE